MASIQLRNLHKSYPPAIRAVDDLSLDINDGQFVVLLGPSGCGKTTILRLIAGLDHPTSGSIEIAGQCVDDIPPKDRGLALVFQNHALYPHLTVFENIAFPLRMHSVQADETRRRVQETARLLEIDSLLDRKITRLSGGQRQRVALARAIVRQPRAFLFDEPLSSLDTPLRLAARSLIKSLQRRLGATTLYVTHDQEEAMALADLLVVMRDGRLMQADTPMNVYQRPANRFVAGFIGSPPMNFIPATVAQVDGRTVFIESADAGDLTPGTQRLTLYVPPSLGGVAEGRMNRALVLGIRPECFHLCPVEGNGLTMEIEVTINHVELFGSHVHVHADTDLGNRIVARAQADFGRNDVASRLKLYAHPRHVHLFEPGETGMNLCLNQLPNHAIA